MVIMVVVAEKRAVFSALISEASDRKLTFELQRLLVVVIKLGQNKGLLEHDHEWETSTPTKARLTKIDQRFVFPYLAACYIRAAENSFLHSYFVGVW